MNRSTQYSAHNETALFFDKEPVRSRIQFATNKEEYTMSKEKFVAYVIQHTEDYPNTGEISLETAQIILANLVQNHSIPSVTPEEFTALWNRLVHDPAAMALE